ncbi:MAG: DUF6446 family protein [Rhodobacter sp.]|nr:DUF6446 family protein [Rhodobacter sp.]
MLTALIAGAAMYYLQLYAFYDEVEGDSVEIRLTSLTSQRPEPLLVDNVEAIDSDSSPLRFRACFTTGSSNVALSEEFVLYDAPEPLVAPGWFDCFDAAQVGEALKDGTALAFLAEAEIRDGVDRVVAVFDDGRGVAWHQLNETYRD